MKRVNTGRMQSLFSDTAWGTLTVLLGFERLQPISVLFCLKVSELFTIKISQHLMQLPFLHAYHSVYLSAPDF
jgi:hypothetical protein